MHLEVNTDQEEVKPHTPNNPTLVVIRGLYGSGKTYVANALEQLIGKEKVVLLDPDAIDLESDEYVEFSKGLSAKGMELKFHPNQYLRAIAFKAMLGGKIIIWHQPFGLLGGFRRTIGSLQDFAKEHGFTLPILVAEVEIDPEVAKVRIMARKTQGGHGPSDEAFDNYVSEYKSFVSEGYKTISVNGTDEPRVSAATILKALKELQSARA